MVYKKEKSKNLNMTYASEPKEKMSAAMRLMVTKKVKKTSIMTVIKTAMKRPTTAA